MSLVDCIINRLNIDEKSKKQSFTVVTYDISNSCCTSQAENNFEMTIDHLSFKELIHYLFKHVLPNLDVSFDEDADAPFDDTDEENVDFLNILVDGFKKIIDKKRLSIFNCDCGLDFFIFETTNSQPQLKINNNEFNDERYYIHNFFEF